MLDFVHLHLHTEYSLLEGMCRIDNICKKVKDCSQSAVAITDYGAMYGVIPFYNSCKKNGIKPIIGCELNILPYSLDQMKEKGQISAFQLVLLCENEEGYKNLIKIVSSGFLHGYHLGKPFVDENLLAQYHRGLIALSGWENSQIISLLDSGDFTQCCEVVHRYASIFGKDHFYIELQNHNSPKDRQLLSDSIQLANHCNIPVVATNDCRYLNQDEYTAYNVLTSIQKDYNRRSLSVINDEYYFKSSDEMEQLFDKCRDSITNTIKIADMCQFDIPVCENQIPHFPCPHHQKSSVYLHQMAQESFENKVNNHDIIFTNIHNEDEYKRRINYELSIIEQMGYEDYFLIVQEYVSYAKQQGIAVGPGRGSGAGSLVAYLIGITEIDPIPYGLLFERFLNPERVSMPDFDVDFGDLRRGEIIAHLVSKYGSDRVAQIATFGTLASRAAIRDVGRVLNIPPEEIDRIAKSLPQDSSVSLKNVLQLPEIKQIYNSSEEYKKLIDISCSLEGLPRNLSVHAAGVVVAELPLDSYVPLAVCNDAIITQFDMDAISKVGLLKFDLLGIKYLTIMQEAVDSIKEYEPDFTLNTIPLDDQNTFHMISQGDTFGVFQLEKDGMRQMLSELKPNKIEDLQAAIALYRPGPMDSIPKYIANKNNPANINYNIPQLKPILASTYGCLVYQEQVMEVFRVIASFSYGHADIVRRAMAKKNIESLEAERESFLNGAIKNQIEYNEAVSLFDSMLSFANYAFNKSHAAAYALISYQTAFLKKHYKGFYLEALLNAGANNREKLEQYVKILKESDIELVPPHVNYSEARFKFDLIKKQMYFGLTALRSIGDNCAKKIVDERKNGPFVSFENFIERLNDIDLNKKCVENLIRVGAFDGLGHNRNVLIHSYEGIVDLYAHHQKNELSGQLDMFSTLKQNEKENSIPLNLNYPQLPDLSDHEKRIDEKDIAGIDFPPQKHNYNKAYCVYLRIESKESTIFGKVENLLSIFDGCIPVKIFETISKQYSSYDGKICLSSFVENELISLLGKDNVVIKYDT